MAKYTRNEISTVTASAVNTELQKVETAINDQLDKTGTTPNTMSADLDMNSNDLLNVGNIDIESMSVNGSQVTVGTINSPFTGNMEVNGTLKVTTGLGGSATAITADSPITITANNVGGFRQRDEFGNNANLASIDSDGNCLFGSLDPRMFNLFYAPVNGFKSMYFESMYLTDLASLSAAELHAALASHGIDETTQLTGATLVDQQANARNTINIQTGTGADGAGWLLEWKNTQYTVGSLRMFEIMYDMPDSLNQRLEVGLWDGTTTNGIWMERSEIGSTVGLTAKTALSGSGTTTAMSVGGDTLRHTLRIFKKNSSTIEFYDSNSNVAAGQFQLVATITTNIPTASLYPFIRFRSQGSAVNRKLRIDKVTTIGNW